MHLKLGSIWHNSEHLVEQAKQIGFTLQTLRNLRVQLSENPVGALEHGSPEPLSGPIRASENSYLLLVEAELPDIDHPAFAIQAEGH